MTSYRLGARLAVRRLLNRRVQSVLLILSIMVPVAAAATWFTLRSSSEVTADRQVAWDFGSASSRLHRTEPVESPQRLSVQLDDERAELRPKLGGQPFSPEVTGTAVLSSNGASYSVLAKGLDASLSQGRYVHIAGRAPTGPTEIAISETVSVALDSPLASRMMLGSPSVEVTVVGIVAKAASLDARIAIMLPETLAEHALPASLAVNPQDVPPTLAWLARDPLADNVKAGLSQSGWSVDDRSSALSRIESQSGPGDITNVALILVSVFVLAELTLVLSGVYSLIMGSRQRDNALLSTMGAAPQFRHMVATLDGLVVGGLAALLGVVSGVGLARLLMGHFAAQENQIWEDFRPPGSWLLALGTFAVGAGAIAALTASRSVSSDSVVALRGGIVSDDSVLESRPKRWVVVVTAVAVVLASLALVTRAPSLVGLSAIPALVALTAVLSGRVLRLHSILGRSMAGLVALRLGARHPQRTVSLALVIASLVAAIGTVALTIGGAARTQEAAWVPAGPPGTVTIVSTVPIPDVTAAGIAALSGTGRFSRLTAVSLPEPASETTRGERLTYWGEFVLAAEPDLTATVFVATTDDMSTALQRPLTREEVAALARGSALVTDRRAVVEGAATIAAPDPSGDSDLPGVERRIPAIFAEPAGPLLGRPLVLLAGPALEQIGAVPQPNSSLLFVPGSSGNPIPDDRAEARMQGLLSENVGRSATHLSVERGSPVASALGRLLGSVLVAMLVAAAAVSLLSSALTVNEIRPALVTIDAIGGTRLLRARIAGTQTMLVAAIGSVSGVAVSILICWPLLLFLGVPMTIWYPLTLTATAAISVGAAFAAGAVVGSVSSLSTARTHPARSAGGVLEWIYSMRRKR